MARTLGELVQCRREEMGISMRELAGRLKIANSFLSLLERDRAFPSAKLLDHISRILSIPKDQLASLDTRLQLGDLRRIAERHTDLRLALRTAVRQIKSGELTVAEFTKRVAGNSH